MPIKTGQVKLETIKVGDLADAYRKATMGSFESSKVAEMVMNFRILTTGATERERAKVKRLFRDWLYAALNRADVEFFEELARAMRVFSRGSLVRDPILSELVGLKRAHPQRVFTTKELQELLADRGVNAPKRDIQRRVSIVGLAVDSTPGVKKTAKK